MTFFGDDFGQKVRFHHFILFCAWNKVEDREVSLSLTAECGKILHTISFFGRIFIFQVDLTARIREILRNYPEGTSIFKELLQNADDAGAREVRLVLDTRQHPTDRLASPSMASLQGPALLCWNDAEFSDLDFESIQRIGDSLKRAESQGAKTGRFGQGYNAIYHLTEVPIFVSGQNIVMFDPQASYLPNVNPANPGKMIDFIKHRQVLEAYPDQFLPFQGIYGCNIVKGGDDNKSGSPYRATLFRFPLRTPLQAETSRLSKQVHTVESMRAQLRMFASEASEMLLFLKNVEQISVWECMATAATATQESRVGGETSIGLRRTAHVYIANITKDIRSKRDMARSVSLEGRQGHTSGSRKLTTPPLASDYLLEIAASRAPSGHVSRETWIVCNRLGGGKASELAAASENAHLKLIPWGGVAGRVLVETSENVNTSDDTTRSTVGLTSNETEAQEFAALHETPMHGLAYCFLPLPVATGLPVHVNGFFELSSNRRDIWWGDDMVGEGQLRAEWNRALLCDVAVPCYSRFLSLAAERCGAGALYDSLWPVKGNGPAWVAMIDAFFEAVSPLPLLHTPLGEQEKGVWISPRDAVLIPSAEGSRNKDGTIIFCRDDISSLEKILVEEDVPVVHTYLTALHEVLEKRKVVARIATPAFVRTHFRTPASSTSAPTNPCDSHPALKTREAVLFLLRYCLSDLSEQSSTDLDGLPFLPVADALAGPRTIVSYTMVLDHQQKEISQLLSMGFPVGLCLQACRIGGGHVDRALAHAMEQREKVEQSGDPFELGDLVLGIIPTTDVAGEALIKVEKAEHDVRKEVCEEITLFAPVASRLLNFAELPDKARSILQASKVQKVLNVRNLTATHLPALLRYVLPVAWRDVARVTWNGEETPKTQLETDGAWDAPALGWFLRLWQYFLNKVADFSTFADSLPLLPCNERCVVSLSRKQPVLILPSVPGKISVALLTSLRELGVLTVHEELSTVIGEAKLTAALKGYAHAYGRAGVLECLRLISAQQSSSQPQQQQKQFQTHAAFGRFLVQTLASKAPEAFSSLRAILVSEPLSDLTQSDIDLIATLPIFPVYGGLEEKKAYMPLKSKPLYLLEGICPSVLRPFEKLLTTRFLRIEDTSEDWLEEKGSGIDTLQCALAKKLGAQTVSKVIFLLDHFFPYFSTFEPALRAQAMLDLVLNDFPSLVQANSRFLPALEQLNFVPNTLGKVARCQEMYDPEVEDLAILMGEEFFPQVDFARPDILPTLRRLGLRSSLHYEDVLRIARSTHDQAQLRESEVQALLRAETLFLFLNQNAETFFVPIREQEVERGRSRKTSSAGLFSRALSLFNEAGRTEEKARQERLDEDERKRGLMVSELHAIAWVPVLASKPFPYLPWRTTSTTVNSDSKQSSDKVVSRALVAPSQARLSEDMWYSSTLFGIIPPETFVSELVKTAFGWKTPLPLSVLARQLVAIAENFHAYSETEGHKNVGAWTANANGNIGDACCRGTDNAVQNMQQAISSVVPVIYQKLSASLHNPSVMESELRRHLTGPWVFVGDRFVEAQQVAFASQVNATPYLYSAPPDLVCFAPLFKELGVRASFAPSDFVNVLQMMAAETYATRCEFTQTWIVPDRNTNLSRSENVCLRPAQLELAITLVQRLSDEIIQVSDWEIFAPDEGGKLARATDLVYDDAPWLSKKIQRRPDIRYAHPKISSVTGEKLGIRSVRRLLMETHADTMDFGLSGAEAEAFGQSEALTSRLRHILELYPEGPSILSELIQNADDAGASTVRVMYSERRYGTSSLLGQKMADWQGPALYFYNDAIFSPQDFQNIARIGQASKLDKQNSTGRFGLGVNAVYHSTDLPSFVSGEHLVIFDPHVKFLPGATRQQPGIKIRFVDTDLLSQFPHQFEPYTVFGCTLQQTFSGTLFRFPLRTADLARQSEISKSQYDSTTIRHLLASFKESISRFLLFLRNVDNIEVYVAHEVDDLTLKPGATDNSLKAESKPRLLYRASRWMDTRETWAEISAFMTGPSRAPLSKEAFHAKLASTPTLHLPRSKQLMEVRYEDGDSDFLGCPISSRVRRIDEYLVFAGLGGGAALAMAVDAKHRHLKLIPFGGVAAHVYTRQSTLLSLNCDAKDNYGPRRLVEVVPKRGQVFCFLPLPVDSGLPCFLNGSFELSSNRRDIWAGGDMAGDGKLRSDWNQALLQDVVAPLYVQLLHCIGQLLGPADDNKHEKSRLPFYYNLFPLGQTVPAHFQMLVRQFYRLAAPLPLLWSDIGGGTWTPCQSAMLADIPQDYQVEDDTDRTTAHLCNVLLARGFCVVRVPESLKRMLVAEECCHSEVCPNLVRMLLWEARNLATNAGNPTNGGVLRDSWPATQGDAQILLVYCSSDLVGKGDLTPLDGLPLVPLADGTLGYFAVSPFNAVDQRSPNRKRKPPIYFMAEEEERGLFMHGQHVLVVERERLLPKVAALFYNVALIRNTNVFHLSPTNIESLLSEVLPPVFEEMCEVPWNPGDMLGGRVVPDSEWIYRLWSYLANSRGLVANSKSSCMQSLQSIGAKTMMLNSTVTGISGVSVRDREQSSMSIPTIAVQDIARVCGNWPVLPILRDRSLGSMLVRIDPSLPLLYMTQNMFPSSSDGIAKLERALASLGICVVNQRILPEIAGPIFMAPESKAVVKNLNTLEVLELLAKCCDRQKLGSSVGMLFSSVGTAGRRALRTFFGDARQIEMVVREREDANSVLGSTDSVVQALRALPIYESYEGQELPQGQKRIDQSLPPMAAFCALTSPEHWLPPEGVDPLLLDTGSPTFIRTNTQEDSALLNFLGVNPLPMAKFYRKHVLGALNSIPATVRDGAILKMLLNLPHLAQDKGADGEAFLEELKVMAFVPNGALPVAELRRACELYEPMQGGLENLLDGDAFPAPALCTPEIIPRLRELGLKASLSLHGIILSATSIASMAGLGERERAVKRGRDLLRFLDHHIEELAEDYMERQRSGFDEEDDAFDDVNDDLNESSGGPASSPGHCHYHSCVTLPRTFVVALRAPSWVPVRQAPLHPSLPWPCSSSSSRAALPVVLPPCQTRPQSEMWQCSLRKGIADLDVSSPLLRQALGWDDVLDPILLAHQLVGLSVAFENGRSGNFRLILNKCVPDIYKALQDEIVIQASDVEGPSSPTIPKSKHHTIPRLREDFDKVLKIISGRAWIWVGDEFLPTTRVAFCAPTNARPYLVKVPPELEMFAPLLRLLGVQESFTPQDIAKALEAMYVSAGRDVPLSSADLTQSLALLNALYKTPIDERTKALQEDGVTVYAPAEDGTMHRIDELCFGDAPWLLAAMPQGQINLKFVHGDVEKDVARSLGARSLREALLAIQGVMASIPCACSQEILSILTPTVLHASQDEGRSRITAELGYQAIMDLVELADDVGCPGLEMLLDEREHKKESLLHPRLAETQGPALIIHLKDVVLGFDDLIRLTSPSRLRNRPIIRPYPPSPKASLGGSYHGASSHLRGLRGRDSSCNTDQEQQSQHQQSRRLGQKLQEEDRSSGGYGWPVAGLGLCSLFHLTDVLQVLSGDQFVLFDPCGSHLVSEVEVERLRHQDSQEREPHNVEGSRRKSSSPEREKEQEPIARRYTLGGQNLHTRFLDQFAPFMSLPSWTSIEDKWCLPEDSSFCFTGTVFRCPLRLNESALSSLIPVLNELEPTLSRISNSAPASLLFSLSLKTISAAKWSRDATVSHPLMCTTLIDPSVAVLHRERRKLLENKDWRRFRLSHLWKGGNPAPMDIQVVEFACEAGDKQPWREQWLLLDTLAHGASREAAMSEASRIISDNPLLPLVSAAARLEIRHDDVPHGKGDRWSASRPGRAYSVSDTGSGLGFPCHVNAPFFLCDALQPILKERVSTGRVSGVSGGSVWRGNGVEKLTLCLKWNNALMSTLCDEVIPALMASLRELTLQTDGCGRGLYEYWPYLNDVAKRLRGRVQASGLYDRLGNGSYFLLDQQPPGSKKGLDSRGKGTSGRFVKVGDAFFFNNEVGSPELESFVGKLFPLFNIPYRVARELQDRQFAIKEVKPALLRRKLHSSSLQIYQEIISKPTLALELLVYCLSDCLTTHVEAEGLTVCRSRWNDLAGLPLLLLEDGSVVQVPSSKSKTGGYILGNEAQKSLLPHCKNIFIASRTVECLGKLKDEPNFLAAVGFRKFNPQDLASNLDTILPPSWKNLVRLQIDWDRIPYPLNPLWFYRFWREMPLAQATELLASWPLVPICNSTAAGTSPRRGSIELVSCVLSLHVLRLLPDFYDTRLRADLEAQDAEASRSAMRTCESNQIRADVAFLSKTVTVGEEALACNKSLKSHPRDICLDMEDLEKLSRACEEMLLNRNPHGERVSSVGGNSPAPGIPSSSLSESAESQDAGSPILSPVSANVPEEGMRERVLANQNHPNVRMENTNERDASDGSQDAEEGRPEHLNTLMGHVSMTKAEHEKRLELLRLLSRARAPLLELAFFPKAVVDSLVTADNRDVTRAIITCMHVFKEGLKLDNLSGAEIDHMIRRCTTSSQDGNVATALTVSELEKLRQLPFFETITGNRVPLVQENGPYVVLDDRQIGRDRFLDEIMAIIDMSTTFRQFSDRPGSVVVQRTRFEVNSCDNSPALTECKVLKRKTALEDLYQDLGVATLKKTEILTRLLIPDLALMDPGLRSRVLDLIKNMWISEKLASDTALVEALTATKFIATEKGDLAMASAFLDPRNELLREVFEDEPSVFPPGEFGSRDWLPILGVLGLKTKCDGKIFLECAKQCEKLASLDPLPFATAWKAAKLMAYFVAPDGDLCADKGLTRELAPIRCVPVERPGLDMMGSCTTSEQYQGEMASSGAGEAKPVGDMLMAPSRKYQLVSFAQAAPAKDGNLVWSIAPVLLPHLVPPQLCWSILGLVSPPSCELVVQHLINLCTGISMPTRTRRATMVYADDALPDDGECSALDRWTYREPPTVVFQSIFRYLEEHWEGLPPKSISLLKQLPCVPVGNRLVKAARLYFRLTQDLSPFMFEVPRAFGAYDTLFTALGTRVSPTVQDYSSLLMEVQGECGNCALNPNELEAVLKIVTLLAETLSMQQNGLRKGEGGIGGNGLLHSLNLSLPDDRSVLVALDMVLSDDASWLRGRVHAHRLRVVHPRLSQELCQLFGVSRISEVVHEELEADFVPETVSTFSTATGDPALLSATLTSHEFAHALACLLLTQQQRGVASRGTFLLSSRLSRPCSEGSDRNSVTLEDLINKIRGTLRGFEVKFVRALRSRFLRRHDGSDEEEDITSQSEGSIEYVDRANRIIMLAVTSLPSSIAPAYVLALAVAQIFDLGGRDEEWLVAPMSALLATYPPEDISQVMNLLRLKSRDEILAQHMHRGAPGQHLLDIDRQRLIFRPMRIYTEGEIVAWQSGERNAANTFVTEGEDSMETLRYGVVVSDAGTEDDSERPGMAAGNRGSVRPLLIRTAFNKVQEMLSTQVYSFSATRKGNSVPEKDRALPATERFRTQAKLSKLRLLQDVKEEEKEKAVCPRDITAIDLPAPVGGHQLLAAVDDILSRVNLTLEEDAKEVLARNIRLQRDLESARDETQSVREEMLELSAKLESIKSAFQCHICFQRNVNEILAPCGHTTCTSCRESVRVCPFCREAIKSFFPFHTNNFFDR